MLSGRNIDLPDYWGRCHNGEVRQLPLVSLLRGMLPGTELTTGPNTRAKELVPVRVRFPYKALSEQQLGGETPAELAHDTHCHCQTGLEAKTGS